MTPAALIFDFDGTMVDSEWPIFDMVSKVYRAHDVVLDMADWVDKLGRSDHRPWTDELTDLLGRAPDQAVIERIEEESRSRRVELPLMSGVVELMDAAERAGVPMAVASSSSSTWVDSHLDRLVLAHRFSAVRTRDHVDRTKPDPDLFLAAAAALDVDPARSLAVEDSRHGCRAAKLAGMTCVVVPNRITRTDLPVDADLIIDSLVDFPYSRFGMGVEAG